jgi:4-deoxy-L-threo-5-hexosulose-uronate ketol-isomerase
MENMKIIHAVHAADFLQYNEDTIKERFLMADLYLEGKISLTYTHYDRLIAGVANPLGETLLLGNYENLKSEHFLTRRELGIINVGGNGIVTVDEKEYITEKLDCLYVGKGAVNISFKTVDASSPAVFFLLSAPAHAVYPTLLMKSNDATPVQLGTPTDQNERTIYKYIHNDGIQSCQLVMGLTVLKPGSVWNTMPPHVHDRRSEVYFYFDVNKDNSIQHFMGYPGAYRSIAVHNNQAIASPPWSIHAGKGVSNYGFIWGMAGENKEFTDMDPVAFEKPELT